MKTFHVDGMTCGGCSRAITAALERAGIVGARVDHDAGTAEVPDEADPSAVRQAIEDAGFDVVRPPARP